MKNRPSNQVFLLGFSLLFLVGCGESIPTIKGGIALTKGTKAFYLNVYPIVRQECGRCHASPVNTSSIPDFAQTDVLKSYDVIIKRELVSFEKVETSRLAVKGGTPHGEALGFCQSCDTAMREKLTDAIGKWAAAESADMEENSKLVTAELDIPGTLPNGEGNNLGTFSTMTFPLDKIDSSLAGAQIQIDIQRYAANPAEGIEGDYRIGKPRIVTAGSAIHFKRIDILFNGAYDPNTAEYQFLENTINAGSNPVLSGDYLIAIDEHSGPDKLSIRFGEIQTSNPVSCSADKLASFQTNIQPVLNSSCLNCHGPAGADPKAPTARSRFPMSGDAATICAQASMRVFATDAYGSVLITYPFGQEGGHSLVGTPATAATNRETFAAWISGP